MASSSSYGYTGIIGIAASMALAFSSVLSIIYNRSDGPTLHVIDRQPGFFATILDVIAHVYLWGRIWRPDAEAALALDRLSHATRESTAVDPSPFKAFIERAKLHLRRLGEGWQFGTPTRLMC